MIKTLKYIASLLVVVLMAGPVFSLSDAYKNNIYNPGDLKPVDSVARVKAGDKAPDFTLPSISGERISLSDYRGKKECCPVIRARRMDSGMFGPVARI